MNKEEAIEAAMLARMVGSHLSTIDQFTVERPNNPANKIDMNTFVAPLMGKPSNPRQLVDMNSISKDMLKAYENVNEMAVQMYPDPTPSSDEQSASIQTPIAPPAIQQKMPTPQAAIKTSPPDREISGFTRSDIDSIRNSLKNIDKTLSGILKHLTKNSND